MLESFNQGLDNVATNEQTGMSKERGLGLLDLGSSLAAVVGMAGGMNKTTSQSTNQVTEVNATTSLPGATVATQDCVLTPDI
ncbi:hypothetical protein M0R45_019166 [Rubus argutus]|uniref:Uncharacterized protein n=1 Tax=Rubus argutus TaxID=59490 RepID=A0AAW1X590_RUBAR